MEVGDIINFWKVLEINKSRCKCLCIGCNETVKQLYITDVINNRKKSCGCKTQWYREQASLNKYGTINPSQSAVIKQKKIETTRNNFQVDHPMQSSTVKQKSQQTIQQTYHVDHISQVEDIKQRKKQSFCLNNEQIKQKREQTLKQNKQQIKDKQNRTLLERYNTTNVSSIPSVKQKKIETSLKNYQTDHPQKSEQWKQLKRQIRIDNDTAVIFSDGTDLRDLCDKYKIENRSHAYNLFRLQGEQVAREYIENYTQQKITDVEIIFTELMKDYFPDVELYNKYPQECRSIKQKPDFRLQHKDNVVYVNVDGLYYHCELNKDKNYHKDIAEKFVNNNIRFVQFRKDELINKPEIIKSIILNELQLTKYTIGARKCSVVTLTNLQRDIFFTNNHLMGTHVGASCFGLVDNNNEIVCAMSVRNIGENIEIARFCNRVFTSCQGGFTKLLNHVIEKYKPRAIVSFCDLRYASGESYVNGGFVKQSVTLGWCWTDLTNTFNRRQCVATNNKTQAQNAKDKKWYRIYDAGQAKYIKEIK